MKNYFLAVIFIIINSCNHNTSNDIIDGKVDKNYLFKSSNTQWFPKNYNLYETDVFLSDNNFGNLDDFIIELYMGVKCHDSEREVPRLIKILDEINFSDDKLNIYLLKRDKTSDYGYEKGKNITNTPTIIFYKDSIEINRIVEFPIETLERDIYKIINDIEYSNAYY
ncbi:MAG: thioredoxin [Pelagibacterales bacterium]|nr:thioredoxin [Pelagibacterales bacterium]